ncbi:MAG: prolyl oligopeptidase family serine peptidase [Phycisphaerales bacterium JB043]
MTRARSILCCGLSLGVVLGLGAVADAETYRLPPEPIVSMVTSPAPPTMSVSPNKKWALVLEYSTLTTVDVLAQPYHKLAGVRVNPRTSNRHNPFTYSGLSIYNTETGETRRVELPGNAAISRPVWSPDGEKFAFTNTTEMGVELWIGSGAYGSCVRVGGESLRLNVLLSSGFEWMPSGDSLVVATRVNDPSAAPEASIVPSGPVTQETAGSSGPLRTYQDLLTSPHDEALFDHFMSSGLSIIDLQGRESFSLDNGVYSSFDVSPDGEYLMVERIEKPYSYLLPWYRFPTTTEVIDMRDGTAVTIAEHGLQDNIPIGGVQTGRRSIGWSSTDDTTLVWSEALDGGDPKAEAEERDALFRLEAPFTGDAAEWFRLEDRYRGLRWLEDSSLAMVSEYDRDERWTRTWLVDTNGSGDGARLVDDRSIQDRYNNPGTPVMTTNASGHSVVDVSDDSIFLTGSGSTPEGDKPFIRRLDLATLETRELWRNSGDVYESVSSLLSEDGSVVLTRRESQLEEPNYFALDVSTGARSPVTGYVDAASLRGVHKELVKYEREDGLPLSATLYLPPGYDAERDGPLPLLVWAYPLEYNNAGTAGQVRGSEHRYTRISGSSHLFLLTQGYAIMNNASMPVVGDDPETVNDTFIDQIVANAQAAIDYAVERGVADRDRVGVGGHSYGAFMTANLLAHCDLFRAGIARSGAYNRTLTPFGFQAERRTFWEAPEVYFALSPFMHAHKINEPMLMIHGMDDNNSGTFPVQSRRMYHAIKGNGGTARLVMLPSESHGYRGKESVLHTLSEMIAWMDEHVKYSGDASASAGRKNPND